MINLDTCQICVLKSIQEVKKCTVQNIDSFVQTLTAENDLEN
jgi:hypothetical protein